MPERFDGHGDRVTIGERTFLKKAVVIALLYLTALPAFADDGRIDIASVDRAIYRHRERIVLAPAVCEKHETYEIKGGREKELRDQMTRQGIAWSDGKKYDSVTSWHVTWDYEQERSLQSCSAEAFQATAEITIRYPKWVRTEGAPQELADKWDAYLASLIEHEEGHRNMVVEAVEDLTRAVALLPDAPTCAELDRRVRSLCHERMAKLNSDAKEYDAATLHGAEQGAVFP
jgi:predicted secreted Zn-dependent protease